MAATESTDNEADIVFDRSEVEMEEVLEKGGYHVEVWSAKLKLPTGDTCKTIVKRVRGVNMKEALKLKNLQHRNILKFYGVMRKDEEFSTFIIMEYAENGTIRNYLDERRWNHRIRIPNDKLWKWVYEGACAIHYLQSINHDHRDIKSSNYLLDQDWTVKIGDLSVSKDLDFTQENGVRGTVRWMAPEVIKEQLRSTKSDVFSFGIIIWEMFTTDMPYTNKRGDFQVMNAICTGQRPRIPVDCPQPLIKLMQECWDEDYNSRPEFMEILTTLRKCILELEPTTDLSKKLRQTVLDDMSEEKKDMTTISTAVENQDTTSENKDTSS